MFKYEVGDVVMYADTVCDVMEVHHRTVEDPDKVWEQDLVLIEPQAWQDRQWYKALVEFDDVQPLCVGGDVDGDLQQEDMICGNLSAEEFVPRGGDPSRYTGTYGMKSIDAIRNALTEEEFRGWCKGNALKYIWRERKKGGDEDLGKAGDFLDFLNE